MIYSQLEFENSVHRFVPRSLQETISDDKNGFCSTWGLGAFRTFDDTFYHFTSTCNYILSRHCISGAEDFNIQIRRGSDDFTFFEANKLDVLGHICNSNFRKDVSCKQSRTENWDIRVEIHECQLAFKQTCLHRVTLTKNQVYVATSMMMQGMTFYLNRGLWRLHQLLLLIPGRLKIVAQMQYYLLLVSVPKMMCVAATCACENVNDCLCAGLGAYVHECAAHGVIVSNWRKDICSKPCPDTQVFENDMRTCNRTCRSLSRYDYTCDVEDIPVFGCGCPEGKYMDNSGESFVKMARFSVRRFPQPPVQNLNSYCVPGCVCPDNLVADDNGRCIPPEQCTCSFGGETYASGSTIRKDCNKCTCKAGSWECTKNTCPKECLVHGDGHYVTFDGKRYLYDGNCEYILVEDQCNRGNGTIQILVESVPCCENGVTCSRIIRILTEGEEFKLHDGRMTRTEKSFGQTQCKDSSYSLHTVGLYLIVKFSNGITVIWDKRTRVSITLDPRWKNKVCGLCGNFNGHIADDLTTQGNSLVTNTLEFGNSWKSSMSCSNAMNQTFPCERNPYCSAWAQRKCSIIKDTVFQSCHKKVDPTPFYDACVQEACACDLEGKYLGFCTAVAVYAEACNKADVCIRWRTPDLCPVYCDYYNAPEECSWHYHPCGTLTTKTCSDHNVGKKFSAKLEGCYAKCPVSAPYLDENLMKCVKLTDCTCYHNGKILQPGEVMWNVCEECKCDNGTVTCRSVTTTVKPTTATSTPVSVSGK
ncbi:mucin-19-like [Rhincodon typus]|uniref:mucin-19-like n=1 Tax=Rhincodon typus TaxID=259920 RepID=UPI00202F4703|nr:mucin-19-like [Rhincodon typus]